MTEHMDGVLIGVMLVVVPACGAVLGVLIGAALSG